MLTGFELAPEEQDKLSDIEQQPPFGDRKYSNIKGVYKTNGNII